MSRRSSYFIKERSVEQTLTASFGYLQETVNLRSADVEEMQIFIYKP